MRMPISHIKSEGIRVFLPMPVFPVIEDVGWWQGEDGSSFQQPYRNGFPRRHCLADYRALVRLAKKLGVRIGLGMVLGEWDRDNLLRDIPGATWMGRHWDNRTNRGPCLDEAADYLKSNREHLEIGMHGLCHEFWDEGRMQRSEFHDQEGNMRPRQVIEAHIEAYKTILESNGFADFPQIFLPPALNHSFGSGNKSIQAILSRHGIRFVITRFARARCSSPPRHELLTWESGVGLLERGLSPVAWNAAACPPVSGFSGPILALHWANVLHPDPEANGLVVDRWAEMLRKETAGPYRVIAPDFTCCWRQTAMCCFARLGTDNGDFTVDFGGLPGDIPYAQGSFWLKVQGACGKVLRLKGAQLLAASGACGDIFSVHILPDVGRKRVTFSFS